MKKYRILPLLLIVCLLLTAAFPAAAAKNTADNSADTPQSTANVSSDGVPQSTVQAQEGSYVFGSDAVKSALDEKLQANCVLLADEDSGQYYYTRNIDAKAYPASLTKIMTLLLAVEAVERGDVNLSDTVTAYDDCNADMVEGASNADIKVGETMTFEDFLYCAMISSANEACNVVAEYVCGSISAFVQRMNERAQALGCTGTHFVNPHSLPNDDHYTTAHDLYRITKEALSHELFATICNTVKHTVPATNLSDERTLSNTNGLINPESPMYRGYYYEYAKGVKTGHTDAAGYCLISTAEKDGVRLLCVVLGGKGTTRANGTTDFGSFSDTLSAYRWVFDNYGWRDIVSASDLICEVPVRYGRDSDSVTVRPAQSISAVLPSADAGARRSLSSRSRSIPSATANRSKPPSRRGTRSASSRCRMTARSTARSSLSRQSMSPCRRGRTSAATCAPFSRIPLCSSCCCSSCWPSSAMCCGWRAAASRSRPSAVAAAARRWRPRRPAAARRCARRCMNSTATTSAAAAAERARAQTSPTQNRPPVLRRAILYHLFTIPALRTARTH